MISDEQIKALAVARGFKLTNETGDDLKPYVYEFARDLIALAQQVKPLKWIENTNYWYANSDQGLYQLKPREFNFSVYLCDECNEISAVIARDVSGLDDAKQIAQADFNKRALENLVHGGGA